MSSGGEIFSSVVPGQKKTRAQVATVRQIKTVDQSVKKTQKPKRQYRKREQVEPSVTPADTIRTAVTTLKPTIEERFGSFGLEYIQALTRLLELLREPSRERLVQFIVEAKIV